MDEISAGDTVQVTNQKGEKEILEVKEIFRTIGPADPFIVEEHIHYLLSNHKIVTKKIAIYKNRVVNLWTDGIKLKKISNSIKFIFNE